MTNPPPILILKQPHVSASRDANRARAMRKHIRPKTEGVGNAGCRFAPEASRGENKNHTSLSHHGYAGSPGIPAREWF